jgi:hypothetical protein
VSVALGALRDQSDAFGAHRSSLTQGAGPASRNSVRLGSSPRAPTRVGGLRAFGRVLAAGPVQPVYSPQPEGVRDAAHGRSARRPAPVCDHLRNRAASPPLPWVPLGRLVPRGKAARFLFPLLIPVAEGSCVEPRPARRPASRYSANFCNLAGAMRRPGRASCERRARSDRPALGSMVRTRP